MKVNPWLFGPCAAAVLASVLSGTRAQEAHSGQIFRTGVELVTLDVLVTNRGRPVRGLAAADFDVRDNGVRQTVRVLSAETSPMSLLLVLDVSASVRGTKLEKLVEAAATALDRLTPDDTAGLIAFAHEIRLAVAPTSDFRRVRAALDGMNASGATALSDAIHVAATLAQAGSRRTLLVVFSDGLDNVSWLPQLSVLETLRRTEVVAYFVAPTSDVASAPMQRFSGRGATVTVEAGAFWEREETFLAAAARLTGGRVLTATADDRLRSVFQTIMDQFRARYLLTYSPTGVERTGWHGVTVRLRGVRGEVTARPGYWVP